MACCPINNPYSVALGVTDLVVYASHDGRRRLAGSDLELSGQEASSHYGRGLYNTLNILLFWAEQSAVLLFDRHAANAEHLRAQAGRCCVQTETFGERRKSVTVTLFATTHN